MISTKQKAAATLAVLACGMGISAASAFSEEYPRVIYGEDNRKELEDPNVSDMVREAALSTVAFVYASQLQEVEGSPALRSIEAKSLGDSFGLCTTEPFANQPAAAFCSGFLVGPDLVATAGHCAQAKKDCDEMAIVFNYHEGSGVDVTKAKTSDIFRCKEIVSQKLVPETMLDYALIRLDRPAARKPLAINRTKNLKVGAPVTVIGHPSGLPVKIADHAVIRSTNEGKVFFTTNLDTFGGNSGSAVINSVTGKVEGILVRGEVDYVRNGSCMVANRCEESNCRGEDVTKITEISNLIP